MQVYHKSPRLVTNVVVEDSHIIRNAAYFFKFAAAAYGWKLLNGYLFDQKEHLIVRGLLSGDEQNNVCVCEHTGISREDIVRLYFLEGSS